MFLNALRNICRAFRPSLGLRLTWDTGLRFSVAALRLAQNPPKGTDTDTCRQTDTPTHTDRHRHTDGTPARSVHDPNTSQTTAPRLAVSPHRPSALLRVWAPCGVLQVSPVNALACCVLLVFSFLLSCCGRTERCVILHNYLMLMQDCLDRP